MSVEVIVYIMLIAAFAMSLLNLGSKDDSQ